MAEQQDRVGQQLGNYRLERLLGRGGFAEVYLGEHLRLKRQAAIKVLHAYLSEKEIEDFQREAQIIAALDHPNIVRIFDFDVQRGVPFLVMDYLPNGTLRQRYGKGERLSLPTVVSCVKQVAEALQYAHDQRLIHRDVKPENMLIGRRQEVILSDFGIAAIAHGTSSMTAQASIGTIPYMAPEQIKAQARAASDQYALGIVVYEWLSGVRPFEGTYTEIFAKHLMTPPPLLRQRLPTLSTDVEQVILTALAKEPQERFNNVQAFATALEAASQTPCTSTGAIPEKTTPPPSLSPLLPTLVAAPEKQASVELSTFSVQSVPQTFVTPLPMQTPHSVKISEDVSGRKGPSRRVIVASLAAIGGLGMSGGIAWWVGASRVVTPLHNVYKGITPSPSPLPYIYHGHSSNVSAVGWSPDGKRIASGSGDKTVQVWDAVNGGNVFTYRGHPGSVWAVGWSPDGKRIASGSDDGTVQVWDAVNGGNVFTYRGHSNSVEAVAWSPDGKRIVSGYVDKVIQVWDAVNGGNVFTYRGHSSSVWAVAWSPDGKRIASASDDKTVHVWDEASGGNVFFYRGHSDTVQAVGWSLDGKRIASGSYDKTVQVWDEDNGGNVFTYRGHSGSVWVLAWSPDGKRIASGSADKTVQVWDVVNGGNVFTYQGHSGSVYAIRWSPDGKRIASGSDDETVQVWDVK